MTAYEHFLVLFTFICCGFFIGCSLEAFRRLGRAFRRNVFFVYSTEILFWLMQTAFLYYILWRVNDGVLRVYFIIAIVCGFLCYDIFFKAIWRVVIESLIRIIQTVLMILHMFLRILIGWPLYFVAICVSYPFMWLFRLIKKIIPKEIYENISQIGLKYSTIVDKYLSFRLNGKGGNDSGTNETRKY